MSTVRELFVEVAEPAAGLLAEPRVAEEWDKPSALAEMSVRGLAGHLASQVFFVPAMLAQPAPTEERIGLHEYYARSSWIGSDLDTPFNRGIRTLSEKEAGDDPAALAARVAECVQELRTTLPGEPDRSVRRSSWGPWSIGLDDFVASRILELVVHSDDLAYSVGVATPEFPAPAVELVTDILTRIAIRRHGAVDVLRALSRAERAPTTISAL